MGSNAWFHLYVLFFFFPQQICRQPSGFSDSTNLYAIWTNLWVMVGVGGWTTGLEHSWSLLFMAEPMEPILHRYGGLTALCLNLMNVTEYFSPCRANSSAPGLTWFWNLRLLHFLNHQLIHVVEENKLFLYCPLFVSRPITCHSCISSEFRVFCVHASDCLPFFSFALLM